MKGLAIAFALSVTAHLGGAVWLALSIEPGNRGDVRSQPQSAAILMIAPSDAAELLDVWKSTPAIAEAPEDIETPVTESVAHASVPPDEASIKVLAAARLPTVAPDRPATQPKLEALSLPANPGLIPVSLPELEKMADDPMAALTAPTPVAQPLAGRGPQAPKADGPALAPDHPGPEIMAAAPPRSRPSRVEPRPKSSATAASAPTRKLDAEPPGARNAWADAIRLSIARHHHVPNAALRRGLSGRVVLRITVTPEGGVAGLAVRASSGHDILDKAALATLRRAGRLPSAPTGVRGPITFDVPLTFRTG